MFRRGNKCSQLNYLRSKTKLIKQNNNEAAVCLQARQRLPCNAKFIIKCGECCREREGGQLRWQLWSLLHCPGWKREQPKLKDVGVMFAMKEYCVVTTPHWAFHPSTGRVRHRMILQFDDPDFLFEKSVQIDPSSPDGHWRPIIPIVHWSVIPRPWCQDSHHHEALYVTLPLMDVAPLMMELLMTLSSGCTVVAGGSRLGLVDYVLQTYKSVGTLAALTPSVLRPCHTSLPLLPPPSLQTWSKPQAAVSCEKPTQQSSNWNWLKS